MWPHIVELVSTYLIRGPSQILLISNTFGRPDDVFANLDFRKGGGAVQPPEAGGLGAKSPVAGGTGGLGAEPPALENFAFFCKNNFILGLF